MQCRSANDKVHCKKPLVESNGGMVADFYRDQRGATMADDNLLSKALEQIAFHESEALRLKRWVNDADDMLGATPRFGDLAKPLAAASGVAVPAAKKWGPGAFYNKPFSTAVRMILTARYEAIGVDQAPASVDDIHSALMDGSFSFETSGADAQKNSIRISLGKNSATFVRLPNSELFGLPEWYGKKPGKPGRKAAAGSSEAASSGDAEGEAAVETADENASIEGAPDDNQAKAAA